MTDESTPTADRPDTETADQPATLDPESHPDPAALAEREDVAFAERTYPYDPEGCEADAAGRVVLGVTNDDGAVLLLVHEEADHAIPPNATVDPGESWRAVAREAARERANVSVDLGDPVAVRAVDHRDEEANAVRHRTHHVVFPATPADGADPDPSVEDTAWTAGWYRDLPVDIDDAGDVLDDIERFLPER